jgi:hypothetical protein
MTGHQKSYSMDALHLAEVLRGTMRRTETKSSAYFELQAYLLSPWNPLQSHDQLGVNYLKLQLQRWKVTASTASLRSGNCVNGGMARSPLPNHLRISTPDPSSFKYCRSAGHCQDSVPLWTRVILLRPLVFQFWLHHNSLCL